MNLNNVIFITSANESFGSVRLRCQMISKALGVDFFSTGKLNDKAIDAKLEGKNTFVLMKADFRLINKLKSKGTVIWDVVDETPPKDAHRYITSTSFAGEFFKLNNFNVIPHAFNPLATIVPTPEIKTAYWIGSLQWKPIIHFNHVTINTDNISQQILHENYQKAGVLLNLRIDHPKALFHAQINSGIKLINAMGYGIPSITSSTEPWVKEIGENCTIISHKQNWKKDYELLVNDSAVYEQVKSNCLKVRDKYSLENIKEKYLSLFNSL